MGDLSVMRDQLIDLKRLAEDLRPVIGQWRPLGLQLHIPPEELDSFESRECTPENCFSRILEEFLSSNPHDVQEHPQKYRDKIVEALEYPSVAKGNLAKDISNGEIVLTFTVQSLTKTLDCCVPVWEHFALGLGVQSKFTDKLKCEPKDINLYFTKMLRYWVEHGSKNLDHLVEALKFLSKKNLANKIEKAYKGKKFIVDIPKPSVEPSGGASLNMSQHRPH